MMKEPFLAIVKKGLIEYGLESLEDYNDGDTVMIVPKEIYDLMIDDLAEMEIKLGKIKEVLDSKEIYMEEIDEEGEKKDKLYRIREVLESE